MLTVWICVLAASRIIVGLAPIVAAGPAARLMGFPASHDTPSTRMFARMFGVRDLGLAAIVLGALFVAPAMLAVACLFNLANELGDVAVTAVPLARREGITRPALLSMLTACAGSVAWFVAWTMS